MIERPFSIEKRLESDEYANLHNHDGDPIYLTYRFKIEYCRILVILHFTITKKVFLNPFKQP